MDFILPFATTTAWSSFAAAPVPSITRTWFSTNTGASTLTTSATSGAFGVCAAATVATNNVPIRSTKRIRSPRKICHRISVRSRILPHRRLKEIKRALGQNQIPSRFNSLLVSRVPSLREKARYHTLASQLTIPVWTRPALCTAKLKPQCANLRLRCVATLLTVATEVLLLPAAISAIAQQKQRSPFMKVPFQKLFSVVILAAFSLALAACGGNSTPSSFTISGTVVNLAGTGGG